VAETREIYDELWRDKWGDMQRRGPVHRHNLRRLRETVAALPDVASILDVGCGGGDNLAALAAAGPYRLSGIDISAEAVRIARARVPSADVQVADVVASPLPRTFDLVISIQVVEHIDDDVAALRNMAHMAERFVYISTIAGRMRPSEKSIGHVRNYTREELEEKMRGAGLRVLRTEGWGFPFYSPLFRSAAEALGAGEPSGPMRAPQRVVASLLYQLYRFNVPGRGDVLTVLGEIERRNTA